MFNHANQNSFRKPIGFPKINYNSPQGKNLVAWFPCTHVNSPYVRNLLDHEHLGDLNSSNTELNYPIDNLLGTHVFNFNASQSEYIDFDPNNKLDFGTNDLVISFWARWTSTNNSYFLQLGNGHDATYSHVAIGSSGTGVYIRFSDGGSNHNITSTQGNYNDDKWHHIYLERTEDNFLLYIDGVHLYIVGSTPYINSNFTNSGKLTIGKAINNNSNYYTGRLHDIRIYKSSKAYGTGLVDSLSHISNRWELWRNEFLPEPLLLFSITTTSFDETTSGGVACGGEVAFEQTFDITPTGGIQLNGTSDLNLTCNIVANSDGVKADGQSTVTRIITEFVDTSGVVLAIDAKHSLYFENDQFGLIPQDNSLDLSAGDWTVSFWIYPEDLSNFQFYNCVEWSYENDIGLSFYYNGTLKRLQCGIISRTPTYHDYFTSTNIIEINQWYHVAWTRSGGTIKCYVNGTEVSLTISNGISSGTNINTSFDVYFGLRAGTTEYPLRGKLDEVAIYSSALNLSDINSIYQGTYPQTNLISHWGFNEGEGTVINDNTGQNPGTLINGPTWETTFDERTTFGGLITPTQLILSPSVSGNTLVGGLADNSLLLYFFPSGGAFVQIRNTNYYPIESTDGSTIYDAKGSINATFTGSLINDFAVTPPYPSNRVAYVTEGQYLKLASAPDLKSIGNWTISFWARSLYGNSSSNEFILDKLSTDTGYARLELWLNGGVLRLRVYDASNNLIGTLTDASALLNAGRLQHIAITRECGTDFKFYVDGQLKSTLTDNYVNLPIPPLFFGSSGTEYAFFFGHLDEIRLYNGALKSTEIEALSAGYEAYTASVSSQFEFSPSGGISAAGTATPSGSTSETASGGISAAGDTIVTVVDNETTSGGVSTAGDVVVTVTDNETASGGISTAGDTIITVVNNETTSGGAQAAGDITLSGISDYTPTGGISATGDAIITVVNNETTSGGVSVAGDSIFAQSQDFIPTGSIIAAGTADVYQISSETGTFGATLGSQGIDNATFNLTSDSGSIASGTANQTLNTIDQASGGTICSGSAINWRGTIAIDCNEPGNQSWTGSLGFKFTIVSTIEVNMLGWYDSNRNGMSAGPITVTISNWSNQQTIATQTFTTSNSGQLIHTDYPFRFIEITPVVLQPGEYILWGVGYGPNDLNYNTSGFGGTSTFTLGGRIVWNNSYYSSGTGVPSSPDAESTTNVRYGSANMVFTAVASTFTETPTGSILANGTAVVETNSNFIPENGISVSGTADQTFTYTITGTEGSQVNGNGNEFVNYLETSSGGLTINGSAIETAQIEELTSGGVQLTGTASTTLNNDLDITGGINVSGQAETNQYANEIATDGVQTSGDSVFDSTTSFTASDGLTVSGTSFIDNVFNITTENGLIVSGTAVELSNYSIQGNNGCQLAGDTSLHVLYNEYGINGVVSTGQSTLDWNISEYTSGGLILSGTSNFETSNDFYPSGSVLLSGNATDQSFYYFQSTNDGIVISGIGLEFKYFEFLVDGGLIAAGNSNLFTSYTVESSDGLIISGTAVNECHYQESATDGVKTSGTSDPSAAADYEGLGGSVASGTAIEICFYEENASSGILLAGNAITDQNNIYNEIATGGILTGSSADTILIYNETSANGVIVSGTAIFDSLLIETSTGEIVISGQAIEYCLYYENGNQGLIVGGNARLIDDVIIESAGIQVAGEIVVYYSYLDPVSGGLNASGVSSVELLIPDLIASGIRVGGDPIYGASFTEFANPSVATSGIAQINTNIRLTSEAGLTLAGEAIFFNALDPIITGNLSSAGLIGNGYHQNQVTFEPSMEGSILASGNSVLSIVTDQTQTATGIATSGTSINNTAYSVQPSNGLTISGSIDIESFYSISITKGVIVSGHGALIFNDIFTEGGAALAGEYFAHKYSETTSGGVTVSPVTFFDYSREYKIVPCSETLCTYNDRDSLCAPFALINTFKKEQRINTRVNDQSYPARREVTFSSMIGTEALLSPITVCRQQIIFRQGIDLQRIELAKESIPIIPTTPAPTEIEPKEKPKYKILKKSRSR